MSIDLQALRYPVGKFEAPAVISEEVKNNWISEIEHFPLQLGAEVHHLTEEELDFHYRPEGWTIRQVIHHCADSHMNAFIRFKLALTEDLPNIKPYRQELWAEKADVLEAPVDWSLNLLNALHKRWGVLLRSISDEEFKRSYQHPEYKTIVSLEIALGQYAWHCRHHLAHVKQARKYKNNFDQSYA